MKKIILLFASLMILPINAFANETPQMPTDAEIMQVIKTFNFTPEEQAYLFKETKKNFKTNLITEQFAQEQFQSKTKFKKP